MTDAVFTSPVVAGQRVYVLDGSGVLFAIDRKTLQVIWKFASRGGPGNCNNVSSPAIAGDYVHFGTTAGSYYVLNRTDGALVKEIICGEPVFSAPVVSQGRIYFATLGSQVYALQPNGDVCWTWDFVKEVMGFSGDRWSGEDWRTRDLGRPVLLFEGYSSAWQDGCRSCRRQDCLVGRCRPQRRASRRLEDSQFCGRPGSGHVRAKHRRRRSRLQSVASA
jgi:hypothetical protein